MFILPLEMKTCFYLGVNLRHTDTGNKPENPPLAIPLLVLVGPLIGSVDRLLLDGPSPHSMGGGNDDPSALLIACLWHLANMI